MNDMYVINYGTTILNIDRINIKRAGKCDK